MKSNFLVMLFVAAMIAACSSEPKPSETTLSEQEQQAVEDRMKKDQEAMDSLEKALMEKISADTIQE
jgi:hypothetical protein